MYDKTGDAIEQIFTMYNLYNRSRVSRPPRSRTGQSDGPGLRYGNFGAWIPTLGTFTLDLFDYIHTFNDLSEDDMLSIQLSTMMSVQSG